jgi:hypothetical protein
MALGIDASDGPLELDAVGWANTVIEPHPDARAVDLCRSEHSPQRGSDEYFETNKGGYGIAWQTEYQSVA